MVTKFELREGEELTEKTFFDRYDRGEIKGPYTAVNGDGEKMLITVSKKVIRIRTYQKNKWMRVNEYYRDGTRSETYER